MAADGGPGQAGGPVRGQLPADRLRAVQPGERRLPPAVRADPVQVALAGPAHLHDVAAVERARAVHHPGAGAAAARPALVHRQRGRDLPVAEPRLRRAAGPHRRVRRGPRVPDGPVADGGPARRLRRGRDRRRASGCRAPRRRRSAASTPTPRAGSPGSWRSPPSRRTCRTTRTSRSRRWATTCSAPRCCSRRCARTRPTPSRCTTWAATSSRCSSAAATREVYDFDDNEVPGATERDRGYWRDVGTLDAYYDSHHGPGLRAPGVQPLQPPLADPHGHAAAAAGEVRQLRLARSSRWSGPGSIISGASVRESVISADVHDRGRRDGRGQRAAAGRADRQGRGRAPGDPGQERHGRRTARRSASTWPPTGERYTVSAGGVVVLGKGERVE